MIQSFLFHSRVCVNNHLLQTYWIELINTSLLYLHINYHSRGHIQGKWNKISGQQNSKGKNTSIEAKHFWGKMLWRFTNAASTLTVHIDLLFSMPTRCFWIKSASNPHPPHWPILLLSCPIEPSPLTAGFPYMSDWYAKWMNQWMVKFNSFLT